MEILPNTKYAIKKMLKKYVIVYFIFLALMFINIFIFYKSSIIFLVKNINEIIFSNSMMSQYLFQDTVNTIFSFFAWSLFVPFSLFLLEFYFLKTKKIKIILDNSGVRIYNGKLLKATKWNEYSEIITSLFPYKIKRGQKNKLVISNLFNKKIIEEQINNYINTNNISKNNF